MIRAIFFDLDDTLCNCIDASVESRHAAFAAAAEKYDWFDADRFLQVWREQFEAFLPEVRHGGAWRERYLTNASSTRTEAMRRALHRHGTPLSTEDSEALAQWLSDEYLHGRVARMHLYPDAIAVLERLASQFPLGLITNGPADSQRQEIEVLGVGKYFHSVFIDGEFGFGKPDPSIFLAAASSVGAEPTEVCFIGDSLVHDVRGARKVGMTTCWMLSHDAGDPAEADFLTDSLPAFAEGVERQAAEPG